MCVFLEKIIVLSALLFRVFVGLSWEKYFIIRTIVSNICMAFLRKLLYYPNCFCEYLWSFAKKTIVLSELLFCVFVRLSWENYCIIRTVVTSICEAFLRKMLYYSTYCYDYLWSFLEKTIVLSELFLRVFVRLSEENYCIIRTIVSNICMAFLRKLLYYPNCCCEYLWGFAWENYCIIRTIVSCICEAFLRKLLYYPNCCDDYL